MDFTPVAFRVENHRNIVDSGWIDLCSLTALLGRNESGKTALLDALHKFNSEAGLRYEPRADMPSHVDADEYAARTPWPFCHVRFTISDTFKHTLYEALPGITVADEVICTRMSNHDLRMNDYLTIPDDLFATLASRTMRKLEDFHSTHRELSSEVTTTDLPTALDTIAHCIHIWQTQLANEASTPQNADLETIAADIINSLQQHTGVQQLSSFLGEFTQEMNQNIAASRPSNVLNQADRLITRALPTSIYFSDYEFSTGSLDLNDFLASTPNPANERQHFATNAIFEVGNVDPRAQLAVQQSQQNTDPLQMLRTPRRASSTLTDNINAAYSQRTHRLVTKFQGSRFGLFLGSDQPFEADIPIDNASLGFRAYLSFFLYFSAARKGRHRNRILLLDEPGLHLHPTAQQDLVRFLEDVIDENIIAYTTHSPFMLSEYSTSCIRTVVDYPDGRVEIGDGVWPRDDESLMPLRVLAGAKLLSGMIWRAKTVLVEGQSDQRYLATLNHLCKIAGRHYLGDDVYIVPCTSAGSIKAHALLFTTEELWPVALFDSDEEGRRERDRLTTGLYSKHQNLAMLLREDGDEGAYEIEDLVGEATILEALEAVSGHRIAIDDQGSGSLVERITSAANRNGIDLGNKRDWKPRVAMNVVANWETGGLNQIPDATLNRAEELFRRISPLFAMSGD